MSPFSASYDPMQDVRIATCLAAYNDDCGRTWILVFNEVLWLGTSMYHSLMKPNQLRMTGIPGPDDLLDDNQKLINSHKKVFIPFKTYRTTVNFYSRVLTQRDIMKYTHIIMTGETEWYPRSVQLALVRTNEEEESRKICKIARDPKVRELETDRIMGCIGGVFMEQAMIERLDDSINVRDVKVKEMESKIRHSIIKCKEVSQKCNIRIKNMKDTLIVTTQKGIIHALHPLHQ